MTTPSKGSIWFSRFVLGAATLLFVRIGVGYILEPVASVAPQQIALGSPAALTVMRVSGGVFLGIALVLLACVVSQKRLLVGVGTLMTIATTVTAVRLFGLAVDGPAPFTLKVLKPEIALVVLSTLAFIWQRRFENRATAMQTTETNRVQTRAAANSGANTMTT
jgi:hypothetical protein